MTNISKSHKRFSELFNNPRVLSNPEEFLGPNYKAVLDFWMILDELTEDQWRTINSREYNFYNNQFSEWGKARDEAIKASYETIGIDSADNAALTAWNDYYSYAALTAWNDYYSYAACYATRELIGIHLLLDQQKPLTFFQMFLEVL